MTSTSSIEVIESGKVNAGMPLLPQPKRVISPFEFLPAWCFYTPVVVQSLWLSVKHRHWALPLIANPAIKLSGMVGESKLDIFNSAGSTTREHILPYLSVDIEHDDAKLSAIQQRLQHNSLDYPLVAKPDLGCRGAGVKLIQSDSDLQGYLDSFPQQGRFLLQRKSSHVAEAGVFYVRYPGEKRGKIISMTLKYSPSVVGDGKSTLKQLIEACPRAGRLSHLYLPRHTDKLEHILADGEEFRLAFAGSHSRGAIFRDGNQFITDQLEQRFDQVLGDFKGFYYGRLDVKFRDMHSFQQGQYFDILEINGASSEAAHIWDSDTPLSHIYSTLLKQYRLLYRIGAIHKQRGVKTPSLSALLSAWREEKALVEQYPATD